MDRPRWLKFSLLAVADIGVLWFGALLVWGLDDQPLLGSGLYSLLAFCLEAAFLVPFFLAISGAYHHMVRYAGISLYGSVAFGTTIAFGFIWISNIFIKAGQIDSLALFAVWCWALVGMSALRVVARFMLERVGRSEHRERVVVYGAGKAGVAVLNALSGNHSSYVVGLLDDDPKLQGRMVGGRKIYSGADVQSVVSDLGAKQVILAIASIGGERRREILSALEPCGVRVRIVPGINDLIDGKVELNQLREVQASDLLWRKPHHPDRALIEGDIKDKAVMVTGGGGSIGSELCRQALVNRAQKIIVFEQSEFALYALERELLSKVKELGEDTEIVPVLGDCCDQKHLAGVMAKHGVDTVYHAAAYKHVPMVEHNAVEGVRNNVWGTLCAARAAQGSNVPKFILISTDKAVRPTNVMGASKRVSELVLQGLQQREDAATTFAMVRFGNVLDSAGSVVPLFRQQIRDGGPVTITHADVTRYFMTIPEAAQLVLQAGAMAKGGEVYLLDMGDPVRIKDLAERMIKLSGQRIISENDPNGDIELKIVGLRPGEKLYEELFLTDNIRDTQHPSIRMAEEDCFLWLDLSDHLKTMEAAINSDDEARVEDMLKTLVVGFERNRLN